MRSPICSKQSLSRGVQNRSSSFTIRGLAGANIPSTDVGDENRMWHCLADPTLELWTKRPFLVPLETVVTLRRSGRIGLSADYATEGVTLTLFHLDANFASQPLARGRR